MADNTTLNPGTGGDVVRDIQRSDGAKRQVVVLDLGGSGSNAENLLDAGQMPSNNCMPVIPSSDWTDQSSAQLVVMERARLLHLISQPSEGFVPLEIPTIGI